jgi:hypothetical protein
MANHHKAYLLDFPNGIRQSLCRVLRKVSRRSPKVGGKGVAKASTWKKSQCFDIYCRDGPDTSHVACRTVKSSTLKESACCTHPYQQHIRFWDAREWELRVCTGGIGCDSEYFLHNGGSKLKTSKSRHGPLGKVKKGVPTGGMIPTNLFGGLHTTYVWPLDYDRLMFPKHDQ